MATQSLTEENSDLSENEDVQEIEDPILVAVNAGASLRSPTSAVIARKRKLPANEGKYMVLDSENAISRASFVQVPSYRSARRQMNHVFCSVRLKSILKFRPYLRATV